MGREGMVGLAALAVAIGFATSSVALDSTSRQRNDSFGWQAPNARMLNNKTEDQLDVNSAGYAGYADDAGQLSGRNLNWVRNNGLYAADAGSVDASGITGIATCSSGYVLKKTAAGFTCVNRVTGADVAYSVDASDIAGIANCTSGYVLTRVSGGFTCTNTIQNATNEGGGNDIVVTMSGKTWQIERQFTYTPAYGSPSTTSVATYSTENPCPDQEIAGGYGYYSSYYTGVCTVLTMGNGIVMKVAPTQPDYTSCGNFDIVQIQVRALPTSVDTRTAISIGCSGSTLRGYATRIQ